jgi:hypothetical protein
MLSSAQTGHTFERQNIEAHLAKSSRCPLSGVEVNDKTIMPNHALRNAIQEFLFERERAEHAPSAPQADQVTPPPPHPPDTASLASPSAKTAASTATAAAQGRKDAASATTFHQQGYAVQGAQRMHADQQPQASGYHQVHPLSPPMRPPPQPPAAGIHAHNHMPPPGMHVQIPGTIVGAVPSASGAGKISQKVAFYDRYYRIVDRADF